MNPPQRYLRIFLVGAVAALAVRAIGETYQRFQSSPLKTFATSLRNSTTSPASPPALKKDTGQGGDKTISIAIDDPIMGNPNAPVAMTEYGDFQCYFCGQFARDTEPKVRKDYVETGKVKYIFKNMAAIGKESVDAAAAALCAGDQGKYWEYHDNLFLNQYSENKGEFSSGNLEKIASDLSLNRDLFDSCFDTRKYEAKVRSETEEGKRLGVTGTPTFFINGQQVFGDQPYAVFKTVIDDKLSERP